MTPTRVPSARARPQRGSTFCFIYIYIYYVLLFVYLFRNWGFGTLIVVLKTKMNPGGPRRCLKNFPEAVHFILTEYGSVASHGHPIHYNFIDF